jgi:hypothetical protein|tara:strand:- start:194 stop:643 length:450 start_codon:yes stop_codon:yes gene_type:complete
MLKKANENRPEGRQLEKTDPAYPTAGIFLDFKSASEEEMMLALESWLELSSGGYLPRQVLIGWIARGIMDQAKATQRVAAWKCVKKICKEDLLWDINMLVNEIKMQEKADTENGIKKRMKNKDGTPNLDGMGELARRRRRREDARRLGF